MKNSLLTCHQKYYAKGKVWISAEAPPKFVPMVAKSLLLPGILTLEPHFNFGQFVEELVANKIPLEEAQAIAQSLTSIDEAYFVPGSGPRD